MSSGIFRHPVFGEAHLYFDNEEKKMSFKKQTSEITRWLSEHQLYKNYTFRHCLMCQMVFTEEEKDLNQKRKMRNMATIVYEPFLTTLKDQILNRARRKIVFQEQEILYLLYKIALAWIQWDNFTKSKSMDNYMYAISSEHILFNQYGDIKLISPITSPIPVSDFQYKAPENLPPNQEKPDSWNKSIVFSIGLIGAQLLTLKLSGSFYENYSHKIKFNFQDFNKWFANLVDVPYEIYKIIGLLIDQNPWVRLNIGEFMALLRPYQQKILDMQAVELQYQVCKQSLMSYLRQNPRKLS